MMSLVHYRINELGDIMTEKPKHGGLTRVGARVVERINKLGIILDLSHAEDRTLKEACRISAHPVIDSHSSPVPLDCKYELKKRLRTWDEMETIAKTGGVVCLWPFGYTTDREWRRVDRTMDIWVREIMEIKKRFGIEHVALGTDGGGNLPALVKGWKNISSWPVLYAALKKSGLSGKDLEAFFFENLKRVWNRILG